MNKTYGSKFANVRYRTNIIDVSNSMTYKNWIVSKSFQQGAGG
ncbi:hypothetical protein FHW37_110139 [Neorhizobium alkalisoli]|uniref:Uncharacterized protein n=1 Tax=Neorhizobium alkalisoli TaxID=528178 RepID=A0A561QBY0_9HYPH|nr:hypothetical protein FHW37_110139 [Neorhizobium alkalisoli]